MSKTLEIITIAAALCLLGASFASAQESGCESDDDCADGERCESGLVLSCDEPPCDDAPQVPGQCVNALLGEACSEDADCGDDLMCARTVVATNCPEGDDECVPEETTEDGFCADNATLAASSGLAPSGGLPEPDIAAASGDGAAGGAAPEIMEAGVAPEDGGDGDGGGDSSSGCSVGGQTGGLAGWLPLMLAIGALGLRRRSGPGLV
jgi:hypothetical protein